MLHWLRPPGIGRALPFPITAFLCLLMAHPLCAQTTKTRPLSQSRQTEPTLVQEWLEQRKLIHAALRLSPLTEDSQDLLQFVDEPTPEAVIPASSASVDETADAIVGPAVSQPPDPPAEYPFPVLDDDSAEDYSVDRGISANAAMIDGQPYWLTYDRGFVFRPTDPDETPFELKIRTQNQIRYTGFARDVRTWTDGAGVVSPVTNVSNFQIPRGRLIFSGFVFRRELSYNLNIDYNTVSRNQINFRAYWLAWRFSRAMTVYAGQSKVPGSREWLLSIMNTLGPDRSMATTFFRPSLSQGIWITGEPVDSLYYHAMMSNGFNTLGSTTQQLNSKMTFSGSLWWEPWGEFGPAYSDFEWHQAPSIRAGTSLTYSPEQGPQGSPDAPENADVRLSNGTLLTETGALAPGTTLSLYKIGLATLDLAYKYRGFGLSGEFYLQDIFGLGANAPLPQSSIFQYGGFVQGGYFFIPEKLEAYARTSHVTSSFGTGSEYAGGFNWFFLPDKQNLRFTLDAAWLNRNPADQNRTNLQAGQTGLLLRSQLQIYY